MRRLALFAGGDDEFPRGDFNNGNRYHGRTVDRHGLFLCAMCLPWNVHLPKQHVKAVLQIYISIIHSSVCGLSFQKLHICVCAKSQQSTTCQLKNVQSHINSYDTHSFSKYWRHCQPLLFQCTRICFHSYFLNEFYNK